MRRVFAAIILLLSTCINALIIQPSGYHHALSGLSLINRHPSNSVLHCSLNSPGLESSITRIFNLEQLPYYNFHVNLNYKHLGFSSGISYLDNDLYQESQSRFAFCYNFENLSFGTGINYIKTKTTNYANHSSLPMQFSFAWQEDIFSTAISLHNPFSAQLASINLPRIILWETCLSVSDKSKLSVGFEKEKDFDFSLKLGSDYSLYKNFILLCSYQYQPNRIGTGVIFHLNKMEICYAVRTHDHLDLTHYISLSYEMFN